MGITSLRDAYRKPVQRLYEEEYYQDEHSSYQKKGYDKSDLDYRNNTYVEKAAVLEKWGGFSEKPGSFLDIGRGEGFSLAFFKKRGWDVCGIDLSSYGLMTHNPEMEPYLRKGDFSQVLEALSAEHKTFDFINADNVLEHLPDPIAFIRSISGVMTEETVVCIKVPNDFSIIQELAYQSHQIDRAFWVSDEMADIVGEHLNYFTEPSLTKLFESFGFKKLVAIADWPIEFFLLNPASNYQKSRNVGHDCHVACVTLENAIFETSMEKALNLHRSLAEMGIGRNICVFFKREKK